MNKRVSNARAYRAAWLAAIVVVAVLGIAVMGWRLDMTPVQALAGIGHPARFFDALRAAGLAPVGHAFPDHHAYDAATLAAIPGPRLMTEKDAVKCRGIAPPDSWAVPVDAVLPDDFLDALAARLGPPGPRP